MKSGDDVIREINDLLATPPQGVLATSPAGQPHTSLEELKLDAVPHA